MENKKSTDLFEEAKKYIPGGVNSPARAFLSVEDIPRFIIKADAQYIFDEDGNKYIDYVGSWGPMILGNNSELIRNAVSKQLDYGLSYGAATKKEVEMAKLMCHLVPSFEQVRMVTSGTEATMSAIRAARGYTNREKIVKFIGCYHGHSDALLVKAGSGLLRKGASPDSKGVTEGSAKDTILAEYNNIDEVKKIFEENKGQIACVIVEPVAANMGVVPPKKGFLQALRELCTADGSVLIFDEVITGFRLSIGGAQQYYGVTPDLSTFGKIIGGGLPVGAYGGRKEIMEVISPVGQVYQAGTLAGNPVAVAAGIAQLTYLMENKDKVYSRLSEISNRLFSSARKVLEDAGLNYSINHIESIGSIFFTDKPVENFDGAKMSDTNKFADYFKFMIRAGNYIAPSQFEAVFISYAHREEDIDKTVLDLKNYLSK